MKIRDLMMVLSYEDYLEVYKDNQLIGKGMLTEIDIDTNLEIDVIVPKAIHQVKIYVK